MAAKALIRTDAVDLVAGRIAAVRALPSLWIGEEGLDSLTVYGFFKDFSIEVGESVSKLSLSIEGLSTAAPVVPFSPGSVAWPDVTDPTGEKPADNATNSADPTSPFGGGTVGETIGQIAATDALTAAIKARTDTLEQVTIPAIDAATAAATEQVAAADIRIATAQGAADTARSRADAAFTEIGSQVTRIDQRIDTVSASGGYDDTAVYAEVSRVDSAALGRDAALSDSIQTVSASVTTTDHDLRALVSTKESAAVGREDAISRRVDDLVAQGGGGSEGVDTVARSEVSRVEQAAIGRDNALGTRVDTVSATLDTVDTRIAAKAQDVTTAFTTADQGLANPFVSVGDQRPGGGGRKHQPGPEPAWPTTRRISRLSRQASTIQCRGRPYSDPPRSRWWLASYGFPTTGQAHCGPFRPGQGHPRAHIPIPGGRARGCCPWRRVDGKPAGAVR